MIFFPFACVPCPFRNGRKETSVGAARWLAPAFSPIIMDPLPPRGRATGPPLLNRRSDTVVLDLVARVVNKDLFEAGSRVLDRFEANPLPVHHVQCAGDDRPRRFDPQLERAVAAGDLHDALQPLERG